MPIMGGIDLIKEVNCSFPYVKVIVLSMHDEAHIANRLLKLRVAGIMPKSSNEIEFKDAISEVSNGGVYVHPLIKSNLKKKNGQSDLSYLTKKEVELLNLIYQGLTTKEIAETLHKSINTIETHRRNMFVKSQVKNTASLIKFGLEKWLYRHLIVLFFG